LQQPFADWFISQTRSWLGLSRHASRETTDDDVAWIESMIEDAREALTAPFQPVLVHTDYKEGNVVAERIDGAWRISGIFDSAEAYVGDGEYDLARSACAYGQQDPELLRAFVGAYHAGRPPRPGFVERLALYILHDRLIIWEYGQRNSVWFRPGLSFREWATPAVALPAASGGAMLPTA